MPYRTICFAVLNAMMFVINLPCFYTAFTILFAFKKRNPYPAAESEMRFAVIIPARNEEAVIRGLLGALDAQNYPKDRYDVYVAINHCTDRTEAVALTCGAKIFLCDDTVARKGDVLHQIVGALQPQGYDAYAVFDADNLPDRDFLARINDAMFAGERICKGRLRTGNIDEGWVAGGFAIYHSLCEWSYSRAHTLMGASSNLVGTGFAFHRDVIDALGGWNTRTITEDTEFLTQAAIVGYRVAYVPEAISYDEQVSRFGTSLHQRLRWSRGMIETARLYVKRLFSRNVPNRLIARDVGMLLLVSHLTPLGLPMTIIAFLVAPMPLRLGMLLTLPLSIVGLMLCAVIFLKYGGYELRRCRSTVVLFPLFMGSWFVLQFLAIFTPVRNWRPVKHYGQSVPS